MGRVECNSYASHVPENMPDISVTLDTSHFEMSPLKDVSENMPVISVTLDTSHFEMSLLNDVARVNIKVMSATLDTSHFERSPMNDVARVNIKVMPMTLDTSHSAIDPCGPLEQSPSGDSSRHALTASLSSSLDCGENATEGWGQSSRAEL